MRGKFCWPGAKFLIPVYLDSKVRAAVAARAAEVGVCVSEVVNRLLERVIAAPPIDVNPKRTRTDSGVELERYSP